jgi:hypothetical protein
VLPNEVYCLETVLPLCDDIDIAEILQQVSEFVASQLLVVNNQGR